MMSKYRPGYTYYSSPQARLQNLASAT